MTTTTDPDTVDIGNVMCQDMEASTTSPPLCIDVMVFLRMSEDRWGAVVLDVDRGLTTAILDATGARHLAALLLTAAEAIA